MADPQPAFLSSAKLALAIRRLRAERPDLSLLASDPVAIVGIGCRFPGGVCSAEDYWRMLHDGVDAITTIPPERWDADAYFDADPQAPSKMNSRHGGFVQNAESFDPLLFGIAPREALYMDPQQRLLLEVAWEALWNSGRSPESLANTATGVFVGIYNSDYPRRLFEDSDAIGPNTMAGACHSIATGRISFLLDLHGPSISIDTACSSSLVAVHVACQSLRSGECNVALAGGITLHLTPEHYIGLAKLGMLAPDGRCKTFDSKADGFVPGEGCGIVVLKLLADALKDGDHIYAVIRGTAVNEDGRTNVLTAPNGPAQQAVVRAALQNAQVPSSSISYVETHGTGTPLGDPIEVEALAEVLGTALPDATPCALGAVKSNIGHLEAAAGVAGLIKAALALDYEEIPPNLHCAELNPHISLQGTRFYLPTQPTPWPRGTQARFAGTSSFGFGGTNAHVVLEEAPQIPQRRAASNSPSRDKFLLPISARTPEALKDFARLYKEFLDSESGKRHGLYEICHSAATRRHSYEERLAISAATHGEMSQFLGDFLDGRPTNSVAVGRATQEGEGVVFVCSGQGSQWPRMGMSLFEREPVFRTAIEECNELVQRFAGWSLIDQLSAVEELSKLQHTEYAQPAIFAVEVALARLWQSWGVIPAAIIGHSAGEVAAAHIAGVLDLEEAVRVVVHRGRLMEASTGQGKMAAIHLPLSAVSERIKTYGERVSIAASNSPESTVISGDADAVQQLTEEWLQKGIGCRMLPVDYAFHSAQMQPFSEELARVLGTVKTHAQTVPIISTVRGAATDGAMFDAHYWAQNVRLPVLFSNAVAVAMQMGLRTFLEVGPHPVLLANVGECRGAESRRESLIPSLLRNKDDVSSMLSSLGKLYVAGCAVNWKSVYATPVAPVSLPSYPFQRQRFWIGRRTKTQVNALHPLLATRLLSPSLRGVAFESELDVSNLPYLADHRIDGAVLLPMTAFLEIATNAVSMAAGSDMEEPRAVIDFAVVHPLVLPESGSCTIQATVDEDRVQVFSFNGKEWKLHASGRSAEMLPRGEPRSPAGLAVGREAVHINSFYSWLRERRLEFGSSFCVIESLRAGPGEALARVCLGKREKADAGRYRIHPALLDGCLQTALAAAPHDAPVMYLPFGIDRFGIFECVGASVWAHARVRPLREENETFSADIDIRDDNGTLLARIVGIHLRRWTSRASSARKMYRVQWHRTDHQLPVGAATGSWLVISENVSDGQELAKSLRDRGYHAALSSPGQPLPANEDIQGVAKIISVDNARGGEPSACESLLRLTQELLSRFPTRPPHLVLVTKGAMAVKPVDRCEGFFQAPVWGLGRTIAMEHPELRCRRFDLDPVNPDFAMLAEEISNENAEEEMAFRGHEQYIPRLEHERGEVLLPRRLVIAARGSIENLTTEVIERRAPATGEVEVEVETTGLNFRDVLTVLGTYPGDPGPLGLEFCGRVARVGDGVRGHALGDRVMGIAWGSFASFVNTPAALIASVPAGLNAVEAVSIPNVFLTAYHCLVAVGGMKRGDRVLIHAATGGVGLAAVQLAQQAGAEIFATAGSDEKREYLRSLGIKHVFSSRTLDFAREIPEITGGKGVDLVLNSLAGDFIAASFAVLGQDGRFIEIGKSGVWTADQVAALGKSVRYDVVDLAPIIDSNPELIQSHLSFICRSIADGSLRPLPTTVFEFDDAATAFRYMAQAKHMGKVVLRHAVPLRVSSDATYLVTGGLGAIGLTAAEWLVNKGARNLMLLGRGAPNLQVLGRIGTMRQAGARIEIRAADVTDRAQLDSVFEEIRNSMPPLRGILHCAGIVDDGVIVQQTPERFARVMAPKISGTWNLHQLTQFMPLDFFVLFSSIAGVTGSPSQSAYAAGNAFLDALAYFRRSRGLAALSIDWGPWAEGGMAARVEAQGRRRVLSSIRPMESRDCFECLEIAMESGASEMVIADVDWTQWKNPARMISGLMKQQIKPEMKQVQDGILHRLENVPVMNRRKILVDYLREEALRVLGLSDSLFIDERQPLLKMGLDSLMAVEFRNRLAAAMNRSLSATLLFDYPTLAKLADYLDARETPTQPAAVDSLLGSLESLTDAQAEEMLREELDHTT